MNEFIKIVDDIVVTVHDIFHCKLAHSLLQLWQIVILIINETAIPVRRLLIVIVFNDIVHKAFEQFLLINDEGGKRLSALLVEIYLFVVFEDKLLWLLDEKILVIVLFLKLLTPFGQNPEYRRRFYLKVSLADFFWAITSLIRRYLSPNQMLSILLNFGPIGLFLFNSLLF